MITATFRGGPLDGQEVQIRGPWLSISIPNECIDADVLSAFFEKGATAQSDPMRDGSHLHIAPAGNPRTLYVLGRLDDRKDIAHYHVPPTAKES